MMRRTRIRAGYVGIVCCLLAAAARDFLDVGFFAVLPLLLIGLTLMVSAILAMPKPREWR